MAVFSDSVRQRLKIEYKRKPISIVRNRELRKQLLEEWNRNRMINPITGKKIKKKCNKEWRKLNRLCGLGLESRDFKYI